MKCSSVVRVKRGFACADDNTQACQFHISARLQKGVTEKTGTWTFGKVSKIHTCRNVSFAAIDDEINNENVNESGSDNSIDDDVEDD